MFLTVTLYKAIDNLQFESNLVVSRLPSTVVRKEERATFEKRLPTARKLELEFRKQAKIHRDELILALLVNAWHESRWNPKLNSDGILQLTPTGMGQGMSVSERQNIVLTVQRFVSTERFSDWLDYSRDEKTSIGQISYKFADHILRPKFQYREQRRKTAIQWHKQLKPKPFVR